MLKLLLQDSLIFPAKTTPAVDAETNTECVFIQPVAGRKNSQADSVLSRLAGTAVSVKRSKTFSPSAPINKSQYNCRVSCTHLGYKLIIINYYFIVEQK